MMPFIYGLILLKLSSADSAFLLSSLLSYSIWLLLQKLFTLNGL